MTEKEIGWDEAITSAGFVSIETEEEKKLGLKEFGLQKVEKWGETHVEFSATVVWEDGEKVDGKREFNTTSNRLKKKLRPIFEKKKPTDIVYISILKVGEGFETQYSVKEIDAPKEE